MTVGNGCWKSREIEKKNQWKRNQSNINATLFIIQMARGQDG